MTSAEIRQSFLDFFKSKGHTIVRSSSLLPASPNLLFTNAGMNQFVPIFLGQQAPDVSKWPGATPGSDTRAADTQKCIRAGGKHNDLEDVGLDTYHLTFFEMLGNWSFGDYFKKESLGWGWELLTKVWGIPPKRLFATVYSPDKSNGDPAEFDQEASEIWTDIFSKEGLDPRVHIVHGNKKDNFWMMGETGPCGPCSEIHFNLLPSDDEEQARALVNASSQRCIEIWNHVFIQFNANPDGTYSLLPAKHVDTGMGFDRIAGFYAGTKGFTDFTEMPSAYNTDIFTALFGAIEKLSGKRYNGTLPQSGTTGEAKQEKIDVAFRVIADHIRTLVFAIADGVEPGNKVRNAVIRRILRRASMFGRSLGFNQPFLYKLVFVLVEMMGEFFNEIQLNRDSVERIIQREEEMFNRTLDIGLGVFEQIIKAHKGFRAEVTGMRSHLEKLKAFLDTITKPGYEPYVRRLIDESEKFEDETTHLRTTYNLELLPREFQNAATGPNWIANYISLLQSEPITELFQRKKICRLVDEEINKFENSLCAIEKADKQFNGQSAFLLSATYGFPKEETERLAREQGLDVDQVDYDRAVTEHKALSRAGQEKEIIKLSEVETTIPTNFVGYERLKATGKVLEVVAATNQTIVILDTSPLYAEMGGQVGDSGELVSASQLWRISNTEKMGNTWLHFLETNAKGPNTTEDLNIPKVGEDVTVSVNRPRRNAIQRHHTVTHLLHWALHEVVSKDASQKGSYVGPEKLTFDFNGAALTSSQIADIEKLVNERVLENAQVSWIEVPYLEVKSRKDIMQFFGEKYGETVRVVQIGGKPAALNGFSMELCGGTHTRATGEIGLFRIVAESAISAGVRRIEAISGLEAYKQANEQLQLIKSMAGKLNTPVGELERKIESLLAQQKELEKQLKSASQKQAVEIGRSLLNKAQTLGSVRAIIENLGSIDSDTLQSIADSLKSQFQGIVVLGGATNGSVALLATVSPQLQKQFQAGKIIQTIAPIVGGKGGGRPDNARGGGKETSKLDEALAKAKSLLG